MRLLLIVVFYVSILGWSWGDSLASKNKEGNKLYKEGKIDEALSKWRDAQIENPDSDKLYYNIGNGLHEQKKYEDAFKEYEKSLDSKDSELRSKAYYNIGNTHYRMGKLPEAIEDYKKCLDINPNDEDAKYNIEFIKKKLKEKPKEEEKNQTQEQKEKKDEMSKEDAVRLLDALKDDENDLQKELRTKPVEGGYKVEKDW
ncbi:MAG: tetratricopeptide repeat protein [Candidatus Omnitrophota bacterium]